MPRRKRAVLGLPALCWAFLAPGAVALAGEVRVSVDGQDYLVKQTAGQLEVRNAAGDLVQDETAATKAVFTYLIREEPVRAVWDNIARYEHRPVLHKAVRTWGSLMQYTKGIWAWVLLRPLELLSSGAKGALAGGPLGALGNVLKDAGKDAIIAAGKKVLDHPESACKGLAIEAYGRGSEAWDNIVDAARKVYRDGRTLTYEEADAFLEDYYNQELCAIANQLTSDIVKGEYGSPTTDAAKALLTQLDIRALDELALLRKVYQIVDDTEKGLGQFRPYRAYSERLKALSQRYARKRLEYLTEGARVGLGQSRQGSGPSRPSVVSIGEAPHMSEGEFQDGEVFDFAAGKKIRCSYVEWIREKGDLKFAPLREKHRQMYGDGWNIDAASESQFNKANRGGIYIYDGDSLFVKPRGAIPRRDLASMHLPDDARWHSYGPLFRGAYYCVRPRSGKGYGFIHILEVSDVAVRFEWLYRSE